MRGRQTRRATADHQHVAMRKAFVVAVRIGLLGRLAEAGCITDHFLILRPELARPHEGFVVEARRDEARELLVDRHAVFFDARLRVHAGRNESLIQLHFSRACVRHRVRAGFELHDRVRLFPPRRHDAARTVVLPAARHEVLTVREQRGRERVALVTLVLAAVEREVQYDRAVDASAAGESVFLAHGALPSCALSCALASLLSIVSSGRSNVS